MSKIGIYTSMFNVQNLQFDYAGAICNFCKFADEVVVAVNQSQDKSLEVISKLKDGFPNLYIVECDIPYSDPLLDGKVKDAALQFANKLDATYLLGLDADERVPIRHRKRWESYGDLLLTFSKYESLLIPSINLWGSEETVRWDAEKNKAYKWYFHVKNLKRGAWKHGLTPDGHLMLDKSDGCELVSPDGDLTLSQRIDEHLDPITDATSYFNLVDSSLIYIYHLGRVNFENRVLRNQQFWAHNWNQCSSRTDVKVEMDIRDLEQHPTVRHNLPHWNTK